MREVRQKEDCVRQELNLRPTGSKPVLEPLPHSARDGHRQTPECHDHGAVCVRSSHRSAPPDGEQAAVWLPAPGTSAADYTERVPPGLRSLTDDQPTNGTARPPLMERFWRGVECLGPWDCWPWLRSRQSSGHGRFSIRGRHMQAHRVAYELTRGPIPDGMLVRHLCSNPPCCNPNHLEIGTQTDNMRDMVEAGRSTANSRNARAKLTEENVRAAIHMRRAGMTLKHIAKLFGVHLDTVSKATIGTSWNVGDKVPKSQRSRAKRRTPEADRSTG